ncbi:MAG: hypothetical protein A3K83_01980 [Omnitrophica WOR_2 bacterium RBG_13_44_8b]|nr:MAG: hypothetical protein A3K83_01980 [Omnitrophica WOR_2 bacterium RBG_13_44_8b]
MQPIVSKIHLSLIKKRYTLAVAESCTGGLLSSLLTNIPGSSQYFILGVVVYSNKVKSGILKIPAGLIAKNGAVSGVVAAKMAESVRKLAKTDLGIGVTGIAGPAGGNSQKPKGTVFIAVANKHTTICKKFHFTGNRTTVRKKAALKAAVLLNALMK